MDVCKQLKRKKEAKCFIQVRVQRSGIKSSGKRRFTRGREAKFGRVLILVAQKGSEVKSAQQLHCRQMTVCDNMGRFPDSHPHQRSSGATGFLSGESELMQVGQQQRCPTHTTMQPY